MIDNEPLWVKVAEALKPIEAELSNGEYSSLMVVIGATFPEQAVKLRGILKQTQFLIPGYGAQGGSAEGALSGFINKGNHIEGGFVNSSRGILYPNGAKDAKTISEWKQIIANGLDATIEDLARASRNVVGG